MRKEKRLIACIILAAVLSPLLIPLSASVNPQELDRGKAEKYFGLAIQAKNKVDELMRVVEETRGSEIPGLYDLGNMKLMEAKSELESQEPNLSLVVDLAEEAMTDFRNAFKELITIMMGEGVDLYEDEESTLLGVEVARAHERIDRMEEVVAAVHGIDVSEEMGYLVDARSELNEAADLLEAGRTIDVSSKLWKVDQIITQASTLMHNIAMTFNNQKIEAILLDLEGFADEVKSRLEEAKVEFGPIRTWEDLEIIYSEAQESIHRSRTLFGGGDIRGTLREIGVAREKLNSILDTLEQRTSIS